MLAKQSQAGSSTRGPHLCAPLGQIRPGARRRSRRAAASPAGSSRRDLDQQQNHVHTASLTSSTGGTRTAHEVHRDPAGLRGGQDLLHAGLSLEVFGGESVLGRCERQERVHIRELRCGQRARVQASERDLRRRGRGTVHRKANLPAASSQRGREYLSRGVARLPVNTARTASPRWSTHVTGILDCCLRVDSNDGGVNQVCGCVTTRPEETRLWTHPWLGPAPRP